MRSGTAILRRDILLIPLETCYEMIEKVGIKNQILVGDGYQRR